MEALVKYLTLIGCAYSVRGAGLVIETLEKPDNCKKLSRQGDWLKVHYKGIRDSDGSQFDSSYDRGDPFEFLLGNGEVIQGWDQGLIGMCKGEKRKLSVPPDMAYGDKGAGDVIRGGEALTFEIELVAIEDAPKPNNVFKDIDKDGDNLLSQDEVRSYVLEKSKLTDLAAGSEGEINIIIEFIFQQNDKNGDKKLEPSEWHVPPVFEEERAKRFISKMKKEMDDNTFPKKGKKKPKDKSKSKKEKQKEKETDTPKKKNEKGKDEL